MQVNSNASSSSQQLWGARRQSIEDMIKNVQAGNMPAAQQALTQVQQADQSLGISEGGPTSTSSSSTSLARSKMNLSSLMTAVQGGDLTSAQTAWQNIQANNSSSGYQKQDSDGDQGNSGMSKDISSLLTAVSSGDASGMQTAATAVAKDLQLLFGTQTTTSAQTTSAATTPGQITQATTSNPGNTLVDDLNALVAAAQKGDTPSAQAAEQKLAQDLQGSTSTSAAAAPQQVGGRHHHHHHVAGASAATASTTPAASASTLLSSMADTADVSAANKANTTDIAAV